MHNPLIILNVRIHAGQMLNILLNGTPTVSSSIITKQSVYTSNLHNLNAIAKMKSVVENNYRFSLLFKCGLVVLLTPHSNASVERVFSTDRTLKDLYRLY